MRLNARVALGCVLLSPGVAIADVGALDLTAGAPKEILGKTLGIAWGLVVFSFILGLVVEAFGSSPANRKDYLGVFWRLVIVVALLSNYARVFGTVINSAQNIAAQIAPKNTWEEFEKKSNDFFQSVYKQKQADEASTAPSDGSVGQFIAGLKPSSKYVANLFGGMLFDTLVVLLVLLAEVLQSLFFSLTQVLIALFYILGPLALVFHIPGPSDSAGRWFRAFVTIATWPILHAVLLAICSSLLFQTNDAVSHSDFTAAFSALRACLLMVVLNLAVPVLASAIVGGSVKNVVTPALAAASATLVSAAGAARTLHKQLAGAGRAQPRTAPASSSPGAQTSGE